MEEEIAQVTAEAQTQSQPVALSVLGIDSLRMVNEVLGHDVGNELLQQVSVRLARMKRPEWELARTGGDEFTLLIPSVHSESEVEQVASLITETFEPVFRVGEHELFVRASGGMAISPGSASAEELQSQANVAFRYAKKRKRGRMAMFHPSMATTPPERFALEQHLRFALQKNEFELYYQPQIELQTGKLVGAEALLRWRHPAMGFIAPSKFIPLAEEIGVIEEIGDWTIDEALRYASTWKKLGLGTLRVAVNVSGIQFARADFASLVARRLHRTDIDPQDLELEITETVMMTNFEHVARQLKILRSLGVQIAIDDFGTGHSSLAYLQQLPVHRLKIDQMFVRNIVDRDECPPLLSSIINMSHALELSVIAEGVETEEQLALLARLGCDEIQGYLISKPISGMELMALAPEENWMPLGTKEV
jgi:diguanylate cyclase (GGDEF)-like protein